MNSDKQRTVAIWLIALLGAGIVTVLIFIVQDGKITGDDGGWITAAFLTIREIISKMEKIALGGQVEISNTHDDPVNVENVD